MKKKVEKSKAPSLDMISLHVDTMCSVDIRTLPMIAPIGDQITVETMEEMGKLLQNAEWPMRVI